MENKIRALRSEMGLSQEELARRCGVSRQTVFLYLMNVTVAISVFPVPSASAI